MYPKPDSKKILDDALRLEPTTRAFIAETLLESLDLEQDYPVSPEWMKEIQRRCAEIDSGRTGTFDDVTVLNELSSKYA